MTVEINSPEDIGIYLRDLRKKYKVTQIDLAKYLGISEYTILRYEKTNYVQASEKIIFSILEFFSREYVKESITLSITPKDVTMNQDNTSTSDIR